MAGFIVYQDSYIGATIVSNRFIDEYMTDANDAQLKVYLYLVRMLNAHLETSVSDIADRFNHTEKDVMRAFSYWEKKGLLSLDRDEHGALCGVHLVNLCREDSTVPTVESTHRKAGGSTRSAAASSNASAGASSAASAGASSAVSAGVSSTVSAAASTSTSSAFSTGASSAFSTDASLDFSSAVFTAASSESEYSSEVMFGSAAVIENNEGRNASLSAVGSDTVTRRPHYSASQLQQFTKNGGSSLISLAEAYFGRPITNNEIQTLYYINDELGFSDDLIDYLLQICVEKGSKDFRYIEKVAIDWHKDGVKTVSQAEICSLKHEKITYTIMNRLGKNGSPTDKEMIYIKRWTGDYGFAENIIIEACDRTVMATDSHRFQYAERILSSWKAQKVKSLDDITKLDSDYQQKNAKAVNASGTTGAGAGSRASYVPASGNRSSSNVNRTGGGNAGAFGRFQQNEIDYEALSKRVFVN